ncbi:MAG: hypothetical protein AAF824_00085 [Bacteroidota bacterium]
MRIKRTLFVEKYSFLLIFCYLLSWPICQLSSQPTYKRTKLKIGKDRSIKYLKIIADDNRDNVIFQPVGRPEADTSRWLILGNALGNTEGTLFLIRNQTNTRIRLAIGQRRVLARADSSEMPWETSWTMRYRRDTFQLVNLTYKDPQVFHTQLVRSYRGLPDYVGNSPTASISVKEPLIEFTQLGRGSNHLKIEVLSSEKKLPISYQLIGSFLSSIHLINWRRIYD